jgi:uncharacterized protein (DUF1697 family)
MSSAICYIALLRGINVGGNNIIKMTDLKACFEGLGFKNVVTYIQSGNVLFSATEKDAVVLGKKIEETLSKTFAYKSRVVLLSEDFLRQTVAGAPGNFGHSPDLYRYDVMFLIPPLTAPAAIEKMTLREGVDAAYPGDQVIYFSRLISLAGDSYLNNLIKLSIYKEMTVRNWNTTTKLLALAEKC